VVNPSPGFPLPLHVSTNSGASFVPVELPPDSRGLLCVQQLNNQWVAAGERGVIIHSADAIHWERSVTSVTNDLFEVSYGAGKWVAVGTDGIVLTSVDLNAFSVANSGTTSALNSVCFGSFGFVAVGADGATAHSADGRDWSAQKTQEADLLSVTYGGGTYLAVGEDGHTQASQDGNNWSISHPTSARLRDVAYADGFFFAAESSTPSIGYFSQDGTTWAQSTLPWNVGAVAAADESFWFVDGAATINRVRLPDPEIRTSAELTGPDSVRVEFDAPVARDYTVLSSSDLVNWNSEATLTRGSSDLMS
jgi:hypothetical protein